MGRDSGETAFIILVGGAVVFLAWDFFFHKCGEHWFPPFNHPALDFACPGRLASTIRPFSRSTGNNIRPTEESTRKGGGSRKPDGGDVGGGSGSNNGKPYSDGGDLSSLIDNAIVPGSFRPFPIEGHKNTKVPRHVRESQSESRTLEEFFKAKQQEISKQVTISQRRNGKVEVKPSRNKDSSTQTGNPIIDGLNNIGKAIGDWWGSLYTPSPLQELQQGKPLTIPEILERVIPKKGR